VRHQDLEEARNLIPAALYPYLKAMVKIPGEDDGAAAPPGL